MSHVGPSNQNAQTEAEKDVFRPPTIPTIVQCLHCGEEYESYMIQWIESRDTGFWCCPTEGCDGKGFGFDILPIDPEYVDEYGNRVWSADEGVDEFDDMTDVEELDDLLADESMIEGLDEAADIEAWLSEDDDESIPF